VDDLSFDLLVICPSFQTYTVIIYLCKIFTVRKFPILVSLSQAVVTSHLVVRGSYRSLSLLIYGNTAEDLGQFNIEFDDNALTDLVDSTEGKLEDLPLALHSNNFAIEDSRSSLSVLSIPVPVADISLEVKLFLQLMLKILELSEIGDNEHIEDDGHNVVSTVVSAISSYISGDICESISGRYQVGKKAEKFEELHNVVNKARKELTVVYKVFRQKIGSESSECSELETEILDSKTLVDMFNQINHFRWHSSSIGDHFLSRVIYCFPFLVLVVYRNLPIS
jgi:hypothetical protein